MANNLILASSSPRRKELLSLLNIPFTIIVADIDEKIDYTKDIVKEIEKLSFQKAQAVFINHQDDIVIGSDTVVYYNHEVFGKPKDKEDAKRMIEALRNNCHEVITAVTILSSKKQVTFSSVTKVYFDKISDQEINDYLSTDEALGKAGAYAIQGSFAKFIKKIEGDYSTVVGLPVNLVYQNLKDFLV